MIVDGRRSATCQLPLKGQKVMRSQGHKVRGLPDHQVKERNGGGRLRRAGGSLLIITLWLVTILSVLAVAIGRYLAIEIRLTKYHLARAQAEAMARSGIYLAMSRLDEDGQGGTSAEGYDWLHDDWADFSDSNPEDPTTWVVAQPAGGSTASAGTIEIRMIDDARKFPLNLVQDDDQDKWFNGLRELVGSSEPAQRIADYLDDNNDTFGSGGLDNDQAEPPYVAKNGPVVALEELLDIPGMSEETFGTLRDFATVAGTEGLGPLNINTVEVPVLAALWAAAVLDAGTAQAKAQQLAECREREQVVFESQGEIVFKVGAADGCGMEGLSDDEKNLLGSFGVLSQTFTVQSTGRLDDPAIVARVEARIQRFTDGSPPRIVAWREE